mmetsp:Transcript_34994/g.72875  ORF Transcript_34994/g.72875 Transcript_34994/m.72875 type:complete len:200 (-) Transcript_34994:96-695(-)
MVSQFPFQGQKTSRSFVILAWKVRNRRLFFFFLQSWCNCLGNSLTVIQRVFFFFFRLTAGIVYLQEDIHVSFGVSCFTSTHATYLIPSVRISIFHLSEIVAGVPQLRSVLSFLIVPRTLMNHILIFIKSNAGGQATIFNKVLFLPKVIFFLLHGTAGCARGVLITVIMTAVTLVGAIHGTSRCHDHVGKLHGGRQYDEM